MLCNPTRDRHTPAFLYIDSRLDLDFRLLLHRLTSWIVIGMDAYRYFTCKGINPITASIDAHSLIYHEI